MAPGSAESERILTDSRTIWHCLMSQGRGIAGVSPHAMECIPMPAARTGTSWIPRVRRFGTVVRFTVPITQLSSTVRGGSSSFPPIMSSERRRVLRIGLRRSLRGAGHGRYIVLAAVGPNATGGMGIHTGKQTARVRFWADKLILVSGDRSGARDVARLASRICQRPLSHVDWSSTFSLRRPRRNNSFTVFGDTPRAVAISATVQDSR